MIEYVGISKPKKGTQTRSGWVTEVQVSTKLNKPLHITLQEYLCCQDKAVAA